MLNMQAARSLASVFKVSLFKVVNDGLGEPQTRQIGLSNEGHGRSAIEHCTEIRAPQFLCTRPIEQIDEINSSDGGLIAFKQHNKRRREDPLGEGHANTWRMMLIKVAARVKVEFWTERAKNRSPLLRGRTSTSMTFA